MIKRLNKKIAMLVATASIISLVPATGVYASTTSNTRLETKEGEIDNAIAFKDGKYIFEGYQGDDDHALYYYTGSKVKTLKDSDNEDLSNADLVSKYGDKYVKIDDKNQYLVDLSTGKVSDDDSDSFIDDAQTALKKQLKKADDRYDVSKEGDITSFTEIGNRNFNDVYYKYQAKGQKDKTYTGFTNNNGKYIDASYTANIYAYSSVKGKVVKVENFDDENKDNKLTATLDSLDVIAQDNSYIYTLSKITVKDSNITDNSDTTTASAVTIGVSQSVTGTYIQKIAKAQGKKEDDSYLPKSVVSYQLNNGIFNDKDADKANTAIDEATDYFVKNGTLYAIKAESDSITVTKLLFKKTNDKFTTAPSGINTDSKQSVQIVQEDNSKDSDMKTSTSYDVDTDGNLWVIDKGKIKEYTGDSFDSIYRCDSSFDTLSVYDKDNLVVWGKDKEEYATVSGKSKDSDTVTKATESEATEAVVKAETSKLQADVTSARTLVGTLDDGTVKTDLIERLDAVKVTDTTTTVNVGWNKNSVTGQWTYADANKTILKNQWIQNNGSWYLLNADGSMATGWNKVGQAWYYLNPVSDGYQGVMKTGWLNDNGTWYFLKADGSMATGWVLDNGAWYFLTSSGDMKTGWIKVEGTWYFLNSNGSMALNTTVGGYKLGANGALV